MARKAKSKSVPKPSPAVPFIQNQSLDAAAQVIRDSAARQRQHLIAATSQPQGSPLVLLADIPMPIPRDHPHLALIGRIAVEWAAIEHQLDVIIWRLASLEPHVGACLTAQIMGVGPRFLTLIALCDQAKFNAK